MSEIATFRVYPGLGNLECETGRSGLYFKIRVFETLKELRQTAAMDGISSRRFFRKGYGVCQVWKYCWVDRPKSSSRRPWPQKECGQILLHRRNLGASVVSHECVHAAVYFSRRKRGKGRIDDLVLVGTYDKAADRQEELLAYAVGEMTRQVYVGLEKAGIIS